MPRLGRFLFGDWLKAEAVDPVNGGLRDVAAAYEDRQHAQHHRHVSLSSSQLVCTDTLSGNFQKACLRWRLSPRNWKLEGQSVFDNGIELNIQSTLQPLPISLIIAPESRYYLQKTCIPVIQVLVDQPTVIITRVSF
jgi:hypothetical protein